MRVGTKTLLWGSHQFLLHPLFVWLAWIKLYGWTWDFRKISAFFLHDVGYFSKIDIDGDDGEKHPELAANFFDWMWGKEWRDFCLYHSRSYAKRDGAPLSKLAYADKYAIVLMPTWLHIILARLSGELYEYRALCRDVTSKYGDEHNNDIINTDVLMYRAVKRKIIRFLADAGYSV